MFTLQQVYVSFCIASKSIVIGSVVFKVRQMSLVVDCGGCLSFALYKKKTHFFCGVLLSTVLISIYLFLNIQFYVVDVPLDVPSVSSAMLFYKYDIS